MYILIQHYIQFFCGFLLSFADRLFPQVSVKAHTEHTCTHTNTLFFKAVHDTFAMCLKSQWQIW